MREWLIEWWPWLTSWVLIAGSVAASIISGIHFRRVARKEMADFEKSLKNARTEQKVGLRWRERYAEERRKAGLNG